VPGNFPRSVRWKELSYIVVDELSEDVATLVISEWPRIDERGRRRKIGDSWEAGVGRAELETMLSERRVPKPMASDQELREREVRIGDAFAALTLRPRGRKPAITSPWRLIEAPIYDVSAAARDAAKAALYGAMAPTLSVDEVSHLLLDPKS
jgi:hypothetical protein